MVFQAHFELPPRYLLRCHRHVATADGEQLMDKFNHQIHRVAETVRTIVIAPFLIDGACLEDTRVGFSRDADAGIRLAVFEQDIVMRLILLDEVVLQQKSILLRVHYHIAYIRNMRHQLARLAALMVFLEITIHPSMQVFGFTHIDYLPLCIEVLIHARVLRDTLEERCNMLRPLIQKLHMDK